MGPRRSGNLVNDYEIRVTKVRYLGTATGTVARAGALWDSGRATTFPLAGRVTDARGAGLPGVTLAFARTKGEGETPAAVVTDAYGNWCRSGFCRGSRYAIAAAKTEGDGTTWNFTPSTIGDRRYRFYPFWAVAFQILALVCLFALYRGWKARGGNEGYVPPAVDAGP
jgi:hypothetical protein